MGCVVTVFDIYPKIKIKYELLNAFEVFYRKILRIFILLI